MRCSKCGTEGLPGKKFCAECGSPLSNRCSSCNADNAPGAKFCADCGSALSRAAGAEGGKPSAAEASGGIRVTPEQPDASTALDGERKTVTALFADIKGSTELMEDLDPEEARAIIDPALRIMVETVRRYEGYVVQSTGDGIFALFGAPAAYEDHPQRALYAALQMQQKLRDHGQRRAAQGAHPLEARVGINTGEVVVRAFETGGKVEYTPIGHTANLASRLQTMAPAGSIVVSEYTRRLVDGYFELRALGPMPVKGLSEPINIYEVTGLGPLRTHFQLSARRGLTKFVGRERELEQMQYALELAMDGHGQVVAVMAEAGTGKSRLFYEFKATLPPACKVLEAYSVSHGEASAWLPVLELLRGYFGLQDADDATTRREKVRATLAALAPALADTLPYLFALLEIQDIPDPLVQMDPKVKHQRTLDAIKRIALRESLNQPVVVIFEDLHWIDAQTQALLNLFADKVAGTRMLLLVNYRPEYRHDWSGRSHYLQLRFDPLVGKPAAAMLTELLGDGVELEPLKQLIVQCTSGNPFFIEEMVRTLFDAGTLVRNGSVKVVGSLSQLRLPPTIQGILAARIDRLPAEQKELLEMLAVIGRESLLSLIRKVVSTADALLEERLAELQAAELIYEQPALADTGYIFKHALTQEVAYSSILMERRKLLHERAGQALESTFAEQLDDHLSQLAHHYSSSNNVAKAVEYLGRSGQQAMQRCSYSNAIQYVLNGLERLKLLPDDPLRLGQELSLQLTLGASLMATKGWAVPEVAEAFGRAEELCRQMGEVPQLVPVLYGIWGFCMVSGELIRAKEVGNQLLTLAQAAANPVFIVAAHFTLIVTFHWTGDLETSKQHFVQMMQYYSPLQRPAIIALFGSDVGIGGAAYNSMGLWLLGYPDNALEVAEKNVRTARDLAHPESLAWALLANSIVHQFRNEEQQAMDATEEIFSVCEANGLVMQPAIAKLVHGSVLAAEGSAELGCTEIRDAFRAFSGLGLVSMQAQGHAMLAEAYLYAGNAEEGLLSLEEPLTRTKGEDRNFAADFAGCGANCCNYAQIQIV